MTAAAARSTSKRPAAARKALQGWIEHPADLLTAGIRDAYAHGLAIALPTGPNELGWAMVEATLERDEE